jgi:hypothetical protein
LETALEMNMRNCTALTLLILTCSVPYSLAGSRAWAQETAPSPPSIAFDIQIKKLRECKNLVSTTPGIPGLPDLSFGASRAYGAINLPGSIDELQQIEQTRTLPFEMRATAEYDNRRERERSVIDSLVATYKTISINGKTYYVDPRIENAFIGLDEEKIELGTKGYLTMDRKALLTSRLKNAMNELGKAPLKVAVDLTTNREFFLSAVSAAKKQGVSPALVPFLDLPKKIDFLTLAIDPDGTEIAKLSVTSGNATDAKFVLNSLNGLLGVAKLANSQFPKDVPGAELIEALFANTKVTSNDNITILVINKPTGYEELIERTNERLQKQLELLIK